MSTMGPPPGPSKGRCDGRLQHPLGPPPERPKIRSGSPPARPWRTPSRLVAALAADRLRCEAIRAAASAGGWSARRKAQTSYSRSAEL